MAGIDLRLGSSADTRLLAELMLRASGGLFEQLLDDIMPGVSAEPLLGIALAINQADGAFAHDNAIIADCDGHPCGMALCFPARDYRLPEAVTAIVPAVRLGRIEALIAACDPDSFYIHTLAVLPAMEGRGIARRLLHAAAELAAAHGFAELSLHVWRGNDRALALYEDLGFTRGAAVEIAALPERTWAGPVIGMSVGTADLLARFADPRYAAAEAR